MTAMQYKLISTREVVIGMETKGACRRWCLEGMCQVGNKERTSGLGIGSPLPRDEGSFQGWTFDKQDKQDKQGSTKPVGLTHSNPGH